ncbi:sensor domain-containing diguanylate cyclase/phosphohydrolase [Gudongella sp. SC589]|jgi:diguanylate cyclase (GGDEF)-like protein/PAS domain S-box-containing protein|uniref:sensor domain-containing diguanylate cyclase/phosphohydrolase n=1 Tax=Gudongella sp. SC589 TaxID=3385990 RepID=UPI003904C5C3
MKRKGLSFLFVIVMMILTNPFSWASDAPDFYDLVDSHGSMMIFIDPSNGRIVYANQAAVDFYGYEKKMLETMDVYDLRTGTSYDRVPRWSELSSRDRNTYTVNHRMADGSIKTLEVQSYPYEYGGRTVLFSILEDITQRTILEANNKKQTNIIISGALISIAVLLFIAEARRKINEDIEEINTELNSSKDKLQLILDSTVEGIYGMDREGLCTFCNQSGLEILGYESQEELLGKNMHYQIHHSYRNGDIMPVEECRILKSIDEGIPAFVDDEVFWRKDGSCFDVEYDSHPQKENGEIVGAVVTFTDATEKRKIQEELQYLSFHDPVTNLYNKTFFQEEVKRLDVDRNLPISVIVGDINGLKLTNDILGHEAGDDLIRAAAQTMKEICRSDDIIARTGGDEFTILLPSTTLQDAERICERIKKSIESKKINIFKGSISTGCAVKTETGESMDEILKLADKRMYLDKTLNYNTVSKDQLKNLMSTLHERSLREKSHAEETARISGMIGKSLNLRPEILKRLKDAAYYHDVGKIILSDEILKKKGELTEEEELEMEQHPIAGYRILNLFNETVNIAEIVFAHHERWDGEGYPKGLKGIEIPVLSRIISVSETYDFLTRDKNGEMLTKDQAIEQIEYDAGRKFDPMVTGALIKIKDEI